LTNEQASFQREMNRILWPLHGIELVIDSNIHIDEDNGMVVVAYIEDILITPKGSLEKHHKQVSKVVQLLMDDNRSVEIDKWVFDATESSYFGFMFCGRGLWMHPVKAKANADWPWPTWRKEVQLLLGFWYFYRQFIQNFSGIASLIADLLQKVRDYKWGDAQEALVLKITVAFTTGKTAILRHGEPDPPALFETNASDFAMAGILSQNSKTARFIQLGVCKES